MIIISKNKKFKFKIINKNNKKYIYLFMNVENDFRRLFLNF